MNREVHVRFWESVEVRFLCATQLSERLRECAGSRREYSGLLRVLQSRTDSPILGLSDAGSGLFSKNAPEPHGRKTGHDNDRVSMRSLLVGHYNANYFPWKSSQAENSINKPIGTMEKP
jgi:hypothetical protein